MLLLCFLFLILNIVRSEESILSKIINRNDLPCHRLILFFCSNDNLNPDYDPLNISYGCRATVYVSVLSLNFIIIKTFSFFVSLIKQFVYFVENQTTFQILGRMFSPQASYPTGHYRQTMLNHLQQVIFGYRTH